MRAEIASSGLGCRFLTIAGVIEGNSFVVVLPSSSNRLEQVDVGVQTGLSRGDEGEECIVACTLGIEHFKKA